MAKDSSLEKYDPPGSKVTVSFPVHVHEYSSISAYVLVGSLGPSTSHSLTGIGGWTHLH